MPVSRDESSRGVRVIGSYEAEHWRDGKTQDERYRRYVQSTEWQDKRRQYFRSDRPKNCQGCSWRGPVDLHHRTYERMGKEELTDLIALCKRCHALVHKYHNPRKDTMTLWDATDFVLGRLKSGDPAWVGQLREARKERDAQKHDEYHKKSGQNKRKKRKAAEPISALRKEVILKRYESLLTRKAPRMTSTTRKTSSKRQAWIKKNEEYALLREKRKAYEDFLSIKTGLS